MEPPARRLCPSFTLKIVTTCFMGNNSHYKLLLPPVQNEMKEQIQQYLDTMHLMVRDLEQVLLPDSKKGLLFPKEAKKGLVRELENRTRNICGAVTHKLQHRGKRNWEIKNILVLKIKDCTLMASYKQLKSTARLNLLARVWPREIMVFGKIKIYWKLFPFFAKGRRAGKVIICPRFS